VLLTTDLTEFSVGVYERGADLVEAIAGDVEVDARCLLAVWWGATLPPPLPANRADEMVQAELKSFLDARQPRPFPVTPVVRIGTPAPEIVDEAEASADGPGGAGNAQPPGAGAALPGQRRCRRPARRAG
jgi:hypothetical protein